MREFSFLISVRYTIRFQVKYNKVTDTLKCVFTEKHLHLNLFYILAGGNLSSTKPLNTSFFEIDG